MDKKEEGWKTVDLGTTPAITRSHVRTRAEAWAIICKHFAFTMGVCTLLICQYLYSGESEKLQLGARALKAMAAGDGYNDSASFFKALAGALPPCVYGSKVKNGVLQEVGTRLFFFFRLSPPPARCSY